MYLGSAGRLYSRKSSEEEFSRYVYDCGVMDTFRSALMCLFDLPIKPLNLEEYFAEFLENHASDLIELSILRAELCFKRAEAQDLRIRHENLDQRIVELEQKSGLTNDAFQWMFQSSTPDQDEKKYEIMRRFFKDIEEYHPALLNQAGTAILKEEETWGPEGEWVSHQDGPIQAINPVGGEGDKVKEPEQSLNKDDSYEDFVSDMKKFDPWGILFPHVHRYKDPLMPPQLSDHEPPPPPTTSYFMTKSKPEAENPIPPDLFDSSMHHHHPSAHPEQDLTSRDELDDAKSIAEMMQEQRLAATADEQEASAKNRPTRSRSQQSKREDEKHEQPSKPSSPSSPKTIDTNESKKSSQVDTRKSTLTLPPDPRKSTVPNICIPSSEGFHTWDTEYWDQFLKDGDIAPKFAIRVVDSHSSIFGAWNAPNKDIQLQYFNPQRFSDADSLDVDWFESRDANRTSLFESEIMRNSLVAKQYVYQHVWTAAKFTDGPLPFLLEEGDSFPPGPPFGSGRWSALKAHPRQWYEDDDDDVINTDVSFGDPALRCLARKSGRASAGSKSGGGSTKASSDHPKLPSDLSINRPIPSGKSFPSETSIEDHEPVKKLETQWDEPRESLVLATAKDADEILLSEPQQQQRQSTKRSRTVSMGGRLPPPRISKQSTGEGKQPLRTSGVPRPDEPKPSLPPTTTDTDGTTATLAAEAQRSSQEAEPFSELDALPQSSKCFRKTLTGTRSDYFRKRLLESMSTVRSQQQVHAVASMYPGNPCDPEQIHHFHPYPELLNLKKSPTPPKAKEKRFLKFCMEHYDEETIQRFQRDYDFSFFDELM